MLRTLVIYIVLEKTSYLKLYLFEVHKAPPRLLRLPADGKKMCQNIV